MALDQFDQALWTPSGGWTTRKEREVAKAVEEYDVDLTLGQNRETGEWVVYLKRGPHSGEPFPVFGLGRELPSADHVKRILFNADVSRKGEQIYRDILKSMERQKKLDADAAGEQTGVAAEALEWGFRKFDAHPQKRIFLPPKPYRPKED